MMRAALARGMRRLDAALSNDLLKDNDETENPFGARTKSAEEISRKVRKVRKVLKENCPARALGRARFAGVPPAFAVRRTKRSKCAKQNDEAGNILGWRPPLGAFAGTRKNSFAAPPLRPAGSRTAVRRRNLQTRKTLKGMKRTKGL